MIHLKSVGSIINAETLMVYPAMKNGKPNLNMGCHLTETCEEWNEALTHKDFMMCCDLMGKVMNIYR
tara:strand:+ start:222 stop:422 length:201 start_codon:yes stop_codon:yes gene_type:complete